MVWVCDKKEKNMDDLLKDSLERLLQDLCTPTTIKQIEANGDASSLWESLDESGFADILVAEESGGAGLTWPEAYTLFSLCGKYSVPAPLATTAVARSILVKQGIDSIKGPVTLSIGAKKQNDGSILSYSTPFGLVSDWVIANLEGECFLLPINKANKTSTGVYGSLQAHLAWDNLPSEAIKLESVIALREVGATIWTAMMSGAMSQIMSMVLVHANDRVQFGKSIGKFQAIQQQISVLSESVQASAIATQMACNFPPSKTNTLLIAAAKARVSELAPQVNSIGHAVHGAMGITEEFHLHYLTRRLNEWRMDFGSEGYWQELIGVTYLASPSPGALDFLLQYIDPKERITHG